MKSGKKILIAFLLNLAFSVFEVVGGLLTGSVAILSDAVHDLGDAASIGVSYALERKSQKQPDGRYTYGYGRFGVLGGLITTAILLTGSVGVTVNAVGKLLDPAAIHYDGMIVFALIGVAVNFGAAWMTRGGDSVNQKAVNLHMLEDVLGWLVVLVGAVVMRFTDLKVIDPLLSMAVAVFIFAGAVKNLKEVLEVFLEKAPEGLSPERVTQAVQGVEGVLEAHHIHLWTIDGTGAYATMHIVAEGDSHRIKDRVRRALTEIGVVHAVLELEGKGEHCHETVCAVKRTETHHHHHHHHH